MANKGKLTGLLLILLIIVSLTLAGGAFYLLQKEKVNNKVLQEKLTEVNLKYAMAEKELQKSKESVSMLKLRLDESRIQMDTLTVDLQRERTAKEQAEAKMEKLRIELEQQKGLKSDLEKKFNQAQDKIQNLQARLNELESRKVELEIKVKDLEAQSKSAVELGKIIVSPEDAVSTSTQESKNPAEEKPPKKTPGLALEGKVLVINKDYNFLVINLGSKDGVDLDDIFSVYHDNKYIGDVKVEKVHDAMSATGFVSRDIQDKVTEEDRVVLKTK